MKKNRHKFLFQIIFSLAVIFFVSGCVATFPIETIQNETYQLHQPQKISIGSRLFRSSHIAYAPLFIALQDYNEPGQTLYNLKPIKKGIIFSVAKEHNGNYLIQSTNFDPQGNMAILVTKDGKIENNKPLRSMLFGGADLTQKTWDINQKLFERMTATDSYDGEVVYRGSSEKFIYFQYREYIPGSTNMSYQEILKFDASASTIKIINKKIKILGHSFSELKFVIEEAKEFSGYADFEIDNIVFHPSIRDSVNSIIKELPAPTNPQDAMLELLAAASENYWGLYYDGMDSYSRGRVDSLVGISAARISAPADISERAKYVWMVKPSNSAQDKFSEMWSDGKLKILNTKEVHGQAEIQIEYENGKIQFVYMLLENSSWKFNAAKTITSK